MTLTTEQMDGIFTEEDRQKKGIIVLQCRDCKKWTEMRHEPLVNDFINCATCGGKNYDRSSLKSVTTYNPLIDAKRKPK